MDNSRRLDRVTVSLRARIEINKYEINKYQSPIRASVHYTSLESSIIVGAWDLTTLTITHVCHGYWHWQLLGVQMGV